MQGRKKGARRKLNSSGATTPREGAPEGQTPEGLMQGARKKELGEISPRDESAED